MSKFEGKYLKIVDVHGLDAHYPSFEDGSIGVGHRYVRAREVRENPTRPGWFYVTGHSAGTFRAFVCFVACQFVEVSKELADAAVIGERHETSS